MAKSDNVIRCGLTGKFRDVESLLKMLDYNMKAYSKVVPIKVNLHVELFPSSLKEFEHNENR